MLGAEARPNQPILKEPTQAESLISVIKGKLGNHYYLATHAKTVPSNGTGLLLYREISFVRRVLFGLNIQRLGAQTILTLITDSQHIREMEKQSKTQEILSTPPTRIDGWMPQDGRNLVNQTMGPDDIPADVQVELGRVKYFATAEAFTYIYQKFSPQTFLADKLTEAVKG